VLKVQQSPVLAVVIRRLHPVTLAMPELFKALSTALSVKPQSNCSPQGPLTGLHAETPGLQ
jgi:hypothetical protein